MHPHVNYQHRGHCT